MKEDARGSSQTDFNDLGLGTGGVRAFLIADVRGYTRFTQERGDEAAAALAGEYASIVREVVQAAGGDLLELRGDEALAVFESPRQAVRASLALRDRLIDETVSHPSRPLGVGIGLDVGEAVPVEGGYRGGALNVAARLCSAAGPGEILASREVAHLARKVDGVKYTELGRLQLRGLARSISAVRVEPETEDRVRKEAFVSALRALRPARPTRSRVLLAIATGLALISSTIGFVLLRDGRDRALGRANAVGSIDLSSAELAGWVDVDTQPVSVASGAGSIWVTNEGSSTVSRIDPVRNSVVQTIQLTGRPVGIAFENGALWVSVPENGTLFRINPATNTVVQTLEVGQEPIDIAVSGDDLWVVNRLDDAVLRLDAADGRHLATISVGVRPAGIAVGDDVWIANSADGTVTRVDRENDQVLQHIAVGNGPIDIAHGQGSVWVANSLDGTVSRIDPVSGTVEAAIPVGSGPRGIAFGAGSVWVTNEFDGSVSRIDPGSDSVVEEINVGNAPQGVAVAENKLWFATRARQHGHRGGTLRIAGPGWAIDSIDPATAYRTEAWRLLVVTNDGLVGFKKVGGADGASIVPNLAASIPAPADGGRAYTFELRPGIEYSDGTPVRATDVRASLERIFRVGSVAANSFRGIVGARSCDRKKCDLSRGIVADDESRTITFHLRSPDSEMLYKLAMPFASVLPADTPLREVRTADLPATGPYMVDRYERKGDVVLVRNPNFEEWSSAAQPAGYVNEIVVAPPGAEFDQLTDPVEEGEADLALGEGGLSRRVLPRLLRDYTERVHLYPTKSTMGMVMNTRIPPFDDLRVRRAVNLAIDRDHIVSLFGGPDRARVTCQNLPPNIPGYKPYCPYARTPAGGHRRIPLSHELTPPAIHTPTPDTARARRLVRASGAIDAPVVVWDAPFSSGMGKYFVSVLDDLRLEAKRRFVSDTSRFFAQVTDARTQVQMFPLGWQAEFPVASDFLRDLFSCGSNGNFSGLCESSIDRAMKRGLRLEIVNPAAALRLWARLDRRIVDLAPWAPVLNSRGGDFVSERVGNYQHNPQWGALLSQLWVE